MNDDKKSATKYVMVDSGSSMEEDEIDLLELIRTLLQAWKTIVGITLLCTGLAVAYALYAPEIFKAEILLAPAQEEKSGTSPLSQFGGLAAMAGISIPSNFNVARVLATMQSREFLSKYIERSNLLPLLFENLWDEEKKTWILEPSQDEPSPNDGYNALKAVITIDEDKKSGLITLSVSWKDPEIAAEWANDLVKQLNEQLREQAIQGSKKRVGYLEKELAKTTLKDMRAVLYNLLESEKQKAMLANVNEDFALEVIDPAVTGSLVKPKRNMIVALGGVCGGLLGIFAVFFLQFLEKLKSSSKEKTNPSHV